MRLRHQQVIIFAMKEELSFIKKLSSSHVRSYRFEKTNYQI